MLLTAVDNLYIYIYGYIVSFVFHFLLDINHLFQLNCTFVCNALMEAIALWRNSTKFRRLFSHPHRYLSWRFPLEGENDIVEFDL